MKNLRMKSLLASVLLALSAPVAAEAKTISFMVIDYNEPGLGDWWKLVVKKYEQQTGNTIEIRNVSTAEYYQQLMVEAANGTAADIVFANANNVRELTATGLLTPIDKYVKEPAVKNLLVKGGWDNLKVDDQYYGLPITGRTLEIIYNSCLFKEAGIANPPTTPEEYISAARKLTKKDASGRVVQFGSNLENGNEDATYEQLLMWTIAYGGELSDKTGKFTVDSEPVVKALTFMKRLYDENLVPHGVIQTELRAMFATGQSAMTIDGQWQFPFIQQNNPDKFDCFKSARHPWAGPGTGGTNKGIAINAKASDPDAVWKFLEVAASPEFQSIFNKYSPHLSYGATAMSAAQLTEKPYLKTWIDSLPTAHSILPYGHEDQFNSIWPILTEAVMSSLHDGVEPAKALAKAQAALEDCCGK